MLAVVFPQHGPRRGGGGARLSGSGAAAFVGEQPRRLAERGSAGPERLQKPPARDAYVRHRPPLLGAPGYAMMPSGFVVFQFPRVKSGNACGAPPSLTDFSLNGPTDDQKTPS